MIQRVQTLWLLLALTCMIAFICLPFGELDLAAGTEVGYLFAYDFVGLIIPAGLGVVLSIIAIFSFSKLPVQKSCVILTIMMVLVTIGITVYILCDTATAGTFRWHWETVFAFGALIFSILALVGVNHDIKLLRSYDRLR